MQMQVVPLVMLLRSAYMMPVDRARAGKIAWRSNRNLHVSICLFIRSNKAH